MVAPADGSWELTVTLTQFQVERVLRVKGDMHIGGLMLKLVESLSTPMDWSDHALFWPERNAWLLRTRSTLDQLGIQSSTNLIFTPMHKQVQVVLPDLQLFKMSVDFSANVFNVVIKMCKELGIRHPEELSLARKLSQEELRKNKGISATRRSQMPPGFYSPHHNGHATMDGGTMGSPLRYQGGSSTPQSTLGRLSVPQNATTPTLLRQSPNCSFNANTMSPGSASSLNFDPGVDCSLVVTPKVTDAWVYLYRPRSFSEKARINSGWLDSSRSLYEQGIKEEDIVLLKFKFYAFYDLNPKYDMVRINQIYEQARWSVVSEEIDCTEEEMIMFAALQLQIQQQSLLPQPDLDTPANQTDDEIDAALTDLQTTLEGTSLNNKPSDLTQTPELRAVMRFYKPKKFAFKSSRKCLFTFKETILSVFKTAEDKQPQYSINLNGCEVLADVNISTRKFIVKLLIPSEDGATEYWVRPESEEQYAEWMAAFKLASKGHTMADSSYSSEVKSILSFIEMHHPSSAPSPSGKEKDLLKAMNFDIESSVASRFLNKIKGHHQLLQRILDARSNVCHLSLVDAKLNFIKVWQSLPEFGLTYFIIRLKGSKKEELLAVTPSRLIRMDTTRGDPLKTWSYQNMKSWSINWEIKEVQVVLEEESLIFQCLTADCKVVHEFIGGYIFLSMRSADGNQTLNQELFHKLTGGWE